MVKSASLILLMFLTAVALPARASIVPSEEYGFLESDPLKATIGSSVIYYGTARTQDFDVTVKGRQIRGWLRDQRLHVRFYPATSSTERSKKLLHLIAGLGGDDMGALATYLATLAQREGYAVIVYPNTLTTNFSIAASRKGLVGAAAEDAKDLYHAMQSTLEELQRRGHNFDEHLLQGYSHGALLAAFVNELDGTEHAFNFSRVLLMNPPLNLLHGVQVLDSYSRDYGFSLLRKLTVGLPLKKAVSRHKRIVTTTASQARFFSRVRLSQRESRGLIGKLLMSSLPRTILASQRVNDLGLVSRLLKRKGVYGINFEGYIMRFYAALARLENREFSEEELNAQNSLYRLRDSLSASSTVLIMHNADDFLLTDGDVQWMEDVFGGRALVYPRGGHLGNVFYFDNTRAITNWLNTGSFF